MNLRKNSWHSALVQSTYGEGLTESLCTYFWKLVLSIVVLPFTFLAHIANLFCRGYVFPGVSSAALLFVSFLFGFGFVPEGSSPRDLGLWGLLWRGFLTIVGIALFTLIVYYIRLGIMRVSTKKKTFNKPNILVEYWKAFKGRYCPKITWK